MTQLRNPYRHIPQVLRGLECGWDHFFLSQAFFVSGKSRDLSTKCGCVIVSRENDILSTGWNDHPRGLRDSPERRLAPDKYVYTEHGERNAIYNAGRKGVPLIGARLYTTRMPCPDCARAIIQSGVKSVVSICWEDEPEWAARTKCAEAAEMLEECGVSVTLYHAEDARKMERFRYVEG